MEKVDYKAMEESSIKQSLGTGTHVMDTVQVEGQPVFPWAPSVTIQKSGASMVSGKTLVDIDSELMNITRKNSKDPNQHYKPDDIKPVNYDHLQDGFFHSEDTRLTNPASLYRGLTTNRWIELYKGAQDHVIEPFPQRQGDNTHLMMMELYQPCYDKAFESVGLDKDGNVIRNDEIPNDYHTNYSSI